jgi:hypothetical protein
VEVPVRLVTSTSCCAQPRTCVTVPGVVPSSGSLTVWIESTTTSCIVLLDQHDDAAHVAP